MAGGQWTWTLWTHHLMLLIIEFMKLRVRKHYVDLVSVITTCLHLLNKMYKSNLGIQDYSVIAYVIINPNMCIFLLKMLCKNSRLCQLCQNYHHLNFYQNKVVKCTNNQFRSCQKITKEEISFSWIMVNKSL